MPAVRGKRGWCGCLQDDEPPEITYCVVDHTGTLSLQTLTPTQPIPPEEELNTKFAELVEELDLTAPNKAAMLGLPPEKKWQIYCSQKKDQEGMTDLSHLPENYIEAMKTLTMVSSNGESIDENEIAPRTRVLDGVKTALRTQPHSFVQGFLEADGLPVLLNLLQHMDYPTAQSSTHTSLIGCLKALMNNSTGRAHVLAHPTAIQTIAQSLGSENIKTKVAALEILGAVCLVPGGHKKVLDAMTHYQAYSCERSRFQGIINDLDRSTGIYRDEVNLKTAVMSFVNAVLSYGPGQESLEFRLHLRYEFLMLGIQHVIQKLRKHDNQTLDRHLDFFEMLRKEDEKELARKFEMEKDVDISSATGMFDVIRRKLSHTAAYPHFLSLLQHCLLLPLDYGSQPQHWLLFDRILQQIVTQTENGINHDVSLLDINVKEIVHLLAKEEELVAARQKAEELEKENTEMANKLAKKEQELDQKIQEKEDLEASVARGKERLEKETAAHIEARQRVSALEDRTSELEDRLALEERERRRLEALLSEGSLPDDAKAEGLNMVNGHQHGPLGSSAPPPPPPSAPIPPPPPPAPAAPPPPLLPQQPNPTGPPAPPAAPPRPAKNVPKPSNPLKSFNWSKLPDTKLTGTVWSELDDTKLYNAMDLDSIDKLFCAYQKNGVANDGSIEDLRQLGKGKSKILSVIDGRRAQNCTILLSKLKLSDEEITKVIMSMDSHDELPPDMVEQLLKFTPSSEEAALLEEHSDEIDSLARADRFLYEISKIPHYEQRLRCLHFKKRFSVWTGEVEPRIKAVMEASRETGRSRRLRRVLELVLALGNYMNRGARGNASGFRLASLNRLADTKSSQSKGTTLLHYLVEILQNKFKDALKLEEDMPHVKEAAKVSLGELEKDMAQLKANLKEAERELEFQRSQPVVAGDRFLPVMKEFVAVATCRLTELEDMFHDMKTRFDRAVRLFGEDNSSVQPDDFFGIFDAFLVAFGDAKADNENNRRKKEEEEKRAKQDAEMKKRTMERKNSRTAEKNGLTSSPGLRNGSLHNGSAKGEFDDLISALRTGDVFGEDKIKRNRKSRLNSSPPRRNSLNREDSRERVISRLH
ncbi:disheveled-associated activator of morphogenesis-like protein isoform X2 [Rhodnius prolixus]